MKKYFLMCTVAGTLFASCSKTEPVQPQSTTHTTRTAVYSTYRNNL